MSARAQVALLLALTVPWWVGAIWLAARAWSWLVVVFAGPGYAGLAVLTVVTLAVVAVSERRAGVALDDLADQRQTYRLGGWDGPSPHHRSAP